MALTLFSILFIVVAGYACYDRAEMYGKTSSLMLFVMMTALPFAVLFKEAL